MSDTPIYDQLKLEQQIEALKPAFDAVKLAFQSILDAIKPFMNHVLGIWKQM